MFFHNSPTNLQRISKLSRTLGNFKKSPISISAFHLNVFPDRWGNRILSRWPLSAQRGMGRERIPIEQNDSFSEWTYWNPYFKHRKLPWSVFSNDTTMGTWGNIKRCRQASRNPSLWLPLWRLHSPISPLLSASRSVWCELSPVYAGTVTSLKPWHPGLDIRID